MSSPLRTLFRSSASVRYQLAMRVGSPGLKLTQRSISTTLPRRNMEAVFTPKGVTPIGPYSQAIKANGLVFVSGQIPAEPTGKLIEAGSGLEKAVKITIFFKNLDDFKEMNEIYAQYFKHKPARSSCEAKRLPAGASLEMDIIALQ